jgi:hypothetical protein
VRKRYLAELAEISGQVAPRPDDLNWIGMEGRAINALRELGRFDEALARLDKVPVASLGVEIPDAAGDSKEIVAQARVRRGWHNFFTAIRPVIARRDSSVEPLDLLPRSVALGRCLGAADKLDDGGRAYCTKETAAVETLRKSLDKKARELEALKQSREASGR